MTINISYADSITIQSTTSTRDSGLYKYLLPKYPNFNASCTIELTVGLLNADTLTSSEIVKLPLEK